MWQRQKKISERGERRKRVSSAGIRLGGVLNKYTTVTWIQVVSYHDARPLVPAFLSRHFCGNGIFMHILER